MGRMQRVGGRMKTIFDVGMNTGQDTEYYLAKGFYVVAIEADPLLCANAQRNFGAYLKSGQLKIINVGVSEETGVMPFYINKARREWSSFYSEIAGRAGDSLEELRVKTMPLIDLVCEHGVPHYLKIDIEGKDFAALDSVLKNDIRIPFISVENGGPMLKLLEEKYDAFMYVNQRDVPHQRHFFPPKEGKFVDFQFEFGSSGKFGAELDGEWSSYEDICFEVAKVWCLDTGKKNPNWDDSVGGWFDLHARLAGFDNTDAT